MACHVCAPCRVATRFKKKRVRVSMSIALNPYIHSFIYTSKTKSNACRVLNMKQNKTNAFSSFLRLQVCDTVGTSDSSVYDIISYIKKIYFNGTDDYIMMSKSGKNQQRVRVKSREKLTLFRYYHTNVLDKLFLPYIYILHLYSLRIRRPR